MSVLIKGMEMPKKGVYDAIITFDGDSVSVRIPPSKEPVFSGRIVHIPTPHGRLIDAEVAETAYPLMKHQLMTIPTIIEAEESE